MSLTQDTMDRARSRVGSMVKDKWRLEALLGAGGTACVYSAVHRNGRRVAIKVLHPQMSAIASVVTRFLREGYLANRVGHPNAVAVLDDDRTEDGAVFLVMELLEGHSLESHAKSGGERLPRSTVLRLVDETLDVLAAAHAKGIVHRDIKPANLFMTLEGHIKVLDFGIARIAEPLGDAPLTHTGFAIGTPSFMPPEQARGRWEMVDARTDVWAVGATAYALLIGDRPRHGETTQEEMLLAMTQPLAPLANVLPDIAPEVAAVIDRAVAHDRDARWPDAMAMRLALSGLLGNAAVVDSRTRMPVPDVGLATVARTNAATLALPEAGLTTGRPFSSQSVPHAMPSTRGRGVAIAAALLGVLIVTAGLFFFAASRRTRPAAPSSSPVATLTTSAPPTPSTSAISITTPTPTALPDSTGTPAPPPNPAASASASTRPLPRPPVLPRGPAANPFDQRF